MLRSHDGRAFELLRGTSTQPLYDTLDGLARACRLPFSPFMAAKLVPVRWEKVEVGSDRFAALHRSFTTAFSDFLKKAQSRYSSVLTDGGRIVLHATEFRVVYDNYGYEHVEAVLDDTGRPGREESALLAWIHQLQALSERSFRSQR